MNLVGQEIKRLREARGWSQAQLAVYAGSSQPTVNQIETGKRNPSTATLQKLADTLEVPVSELFPKVAAPPSQEPSFNDVLEEERRLIEFLEGHASGLEKAGDEWDVKLEHNVFRGEEADAALEFWGYLWDYLGDPLDREIRAMKRGESTLSEPVYAAYHRLWTAFAGLQATLQAARQLRAQEQTEPQEMPRRSKGA